MKRKRLDRSKILSYVKDRIAKGEKQFITKYDKHKGERYNVQ